MNYTLIPLTVSFLCFSGCRPFSAMFFYDRAEDSERIIEDKSDRIYTEANETVVVSVPIVKF